MEGQRIAQTQDETQLTSETHGDRKRGQCRMALKRGSPDNQQILRNDCATVLPLPIDNCSAIHASVIVVSSRNGCAT